MEENKKEEVKVEQSISLSKSEYDKLLTENIQLKSQIESINKKQEEVTIQVSSNKVEEQPKQAKKGIFKI